MEKEEAQIGQRVKYVSGNFNDTPSNPLWGGKFGKVKGTLVLATGSFPLRVEWDSGGHNTYCYEDIEIINDKVEIKMKKIKLKKTNKDLLRL